MTRKFNRLRITKRKIPTGEIVEDQHPEFWYIEWDGNRLNIHYGGIATCGKKKTLSFKTAEDAFSAYETIVSKKLQEGFTEVYDGTEVPEIDLAWLRTEIREQARKAFDVVRRSHPEETICGYALYSCSEANHISHVAVSEELVNASSDSDVRWCAGEWSYDEGGEAFETINDKLGQRSDAKYTNPWDPEDNFSELFFETCVQALKDLDREGYFGADSAREQTFVTFCYDEMVNDDDWVQLLNPPSVYEHYRKWQAGD